MKGRDPARTLQRLPKRGISLPINVVITVIIAVMALTLVAIFVTGAGKSLTGKYSTFGKTTVGGISIPNILGKPTAVASALSGGPAPQTPAPTEPKACEGFDPSGINIPGPGGKIPLVLLNLCPFECPASCFCKDVTAEVGKICLANEKTLNCGLAENGQCSKYTQCCKNGCEVVQPALCLQK